MNIDNCQHRWDITADEYLPVSKSINRHHPCKECGLINYMPQKTQLKTGKLIVLIKEMFEQYEIPRNQMRHYTDRIKQMKREGLTDDRIIGTIIAEAHGENRHQVSAADDIRWAI